MAPTRIRGAPNARRRKRRPMFRRPEHDARRRKFVLSLKRRLQSQVSIAGTLNARDRAYIEIPFREGSSERNQVAAYIVSQIGQNAQSVQTTAESHLRCSRRNRYPPKAPRVRMKGLHLAMKAFTARPARCGRRGAARRRRCVTARRERVTSLSRPAPSRSRASSGRLPAHPTSLPRPVRDLAIRAKVQLRLRRALCRFRDAFLHLCARDRVVVPEDRAVTLDRDVDRLRFSSTGWLLACGRSIFTACCIAGIVTRKMIRRA